MIVRLSHQISVIFLFTAQAFAFDVKVATGKLTEADCQKIKHEFYQRINDCDNKNIYEGILKKIEEANTCEKLSKDLLKLWNKLFTESPFKEDRTCPAKHGNYDSPGESLIYTFQYLLEKEMQKLLADKKTNINDFIKMPTEVHQTEFVFNLAQQTSLQKDSRTELYKIVFKKLSERFNDPEFYFSEHVEEMLKVIEREIGVKAQGKFYSVLRAIPGPSCSGFAGLGFEIKIPRENLNKANKDKIVQLLFSIIDEEYELIKNKLSYDQREYKGGFPKVSQKVTVQDKEVIKTLNEIKSKYENQDLQNWIKQSKLEKIQKTILDNFKNYSIDIELSTDLLTEALDKYEPKYLDGSDCD